MDPEKVNAITTWPWPANCRELKRFLGFIGFYQQFAWNYATITEPLNHLTQGFQVGRPQASGGDLMADCPGR